MATQIAAATEAAADFFTYDRAGDSYRHWNVRIEGRVATLAMDVDPDGGLNPGYKLKLNSYDLGVDIELHDIVQRLRFEHPEVGCVVLTSANDRIFCSGANIYMLGTSTHAWKVNFCKFTNETRNGFEDSSANGSLKFLAAVNGTCAGGGYEVALACDEILLVDDRSSAVSLPEVPLLAVLPGTGGLTRAPASSKMSLKTSSVSGRMRVVAESSKHCHPRANRRLTDRHHWASPTYRHCLRAQLAPSPPRALPAPRSQAPGRDRNRLA